LISYEKNLLEDKTGNLPPLKSQLEKLKIKRQDELIRANTKTGKKIQLILEKQDRLLRTIKELKDARLEGEACNKDITAVVRAFE